MSSALKILQRGLRLVLAGTAGLLIWTAWLILAIALAFQLWLLSSQEIAVPEFLREALRERLAAAQLEASFGRALLDPSGRVLIEDVQIGTPSFTEPFVTARAVFADLDPWALLVGDFQPQRVTATGVSFYVPAMLSASGRPEEAVSNIDFSARIRDREVEIEGLSATLGRLTLIAHGTLPVASWRSGGKRSLPLADFLAQQYPRLSREFADLTSSFEAFERPVLRLSIAPEGDDRIDVDAAFQAEDARMSDPVAFDSDRVRASTRVTLGGTGTIDTDIVVAADAVRLPGGTLIAEPTGLVRAEIDPGTRRFTAGAVRIAAVAVSADELPRPLTSLSARLEPPLDPATLSGEIDAKFAGIDMALAGQADFRNRSATLQVDGTVTPELLDIAAEHFGSGLRDRIELGRPVPVEAAVRLDPGWRLATIDTRLDVRSVRARNVPLDDVQGHVTLDGTTLRADEILLQRGDERVRGSYEMNTATREFRFLLGGTLRPLDISPWFRDWWTRLFSNFEFSRPGEANADIRGRWGRPLESATFISVDATDMSLRGVPFDSAHTIIFARPGFTDVREFRGTQGDAEAHGAFTRTFDVDTKDMKTTDFDISSTLDIREGARIFGERGDPVVAPFDFSLPPAITASGRFEGPGSPDGVHRHVRVEGSNSGDVSIFGFPLANSTFQAEIVDDVIDVSHVEADYGGGRTSGSIRLSGTADDQEVEFDLAIAGARLASAVTTLSSYTARRHAEEPPVAGTYLTRAGDLQLDLTAAGRGPARDLLGLQGSGHAILAGPELGQVKLLGILSDLFTFSSLRFTRLQTDFQIDGPQLSFPNLRLTGANSAIDANGTYALDRKSLDIRARVFPFQESNAFLQSAVGAVLSPLSEILEVRLTGSLENPTWAFVAGPTNFLRNLVEPLAPTAPTTPRPASPDSSSTESPVP